ncbi:MAG TPA: hypothetical protein VEC93_00075, partial [Anaerolineae bacterium]|nr:hypothetical protein [Anaerolineae bacterium]
ARLYRESAIAGGFSVTFFFFFLGRLLGLDLPLQLIANAALIVFFIGALWLLWRTWRGQSPVWGTAAIFLLYILQTASFRIWYTVWPFPWLLLDEVDTSQPAPIYRLHVGWLLLLTAQLSVLIYGHVRLHLFAGDHLPAHLVGVPFTFLLPAILATWSAGWGKKRLSGSV